MINPANVTTAFEFPNMRVTQSLGLVRGIAVRSLFKGNLNTALPTLKGNDIGAFIELCEKAREEAFNLMLEHAAEIGANAIIGARYDANEIGAGITEVLAYGTAVVVETIGT